MRAKTNLSLSLPAFAEAKLQLRAGRSKGEPDSIRTNPAPLWLGPGDTNRQYAWRGLGVRDMAKFVDLRHELHEAEHRLLVELRLMRRKFRDLRAPSTELTLGQRVADRVAAGMGS